MTCPYCQGEIRYDLLPELNLREIQYIDCPHCDKKCEIETDYMFDGEDEYPFISGLCKSESTFEPYVYREPVYVPSKREIELTEKIKKFFSR